MLEPARTQHLGPRPRPRPRPGPRPRRSWSRVASRTAVALCCSFGRSPSAEHGGSSSTRSKEPPGPTRHAWPRAVSNGPPCYRVCAAAQGALLMCRAPGHVLGRAPGHEGRGTGGGHRRTRKRQPRHARVGVAEAGGVGAERVDAAQPEEPAQRAQLAELAVVALARDQARAALHVVAQEVGRDVGRLRAGRAAHV